MAFETVTQQGVAAFALGQLLSESLELSDAIAATNKTWQALRTATKENLVKLGWLDNSTATAAVDHVSNLISVIAVPEHLNTAPEMERFYSYLPEFTQPFLQSWLSAIKRWSDTYKRLLKEDPSVAVHREDIPLVMTDVNAYYSAIYHLMVIPPAIMMPPFVATKVPEFVNYGAIGKILGHELTHSFDPKFSTMSRTGDVVNWYTNRSWLNFEKRVNCVIKQLSDSTNSPTHALEAFSEAFADTAGMEKAHLAYQTLPDKQGFLGYSREQLFFVAGCFVFCSSQPYRSEGIYPAYALRCNLPASNDKHFAQVFKCAPGSWFNPQNRCTFHET
ncbi:hypothetical protein HPB48_020853 [Haemaphysalis longicornis]|uniref:Peptidase M13 C-terminal domain-containing protein n=1 Tax=Haemaphysalis longicornis TaxID=44386 RepID=A0A9J6FZR5_HAELO|nr:hypothetical protein HPB48_020853 [Haemaphysalis longicornis]